jgi:glycosyltransferase involved in cell wall biosynthesis
MALLRMRWRRRARLILVQHRLAGMTGHRYHQTLGLAAAARRRGMEPLVLINEEADAALCAAVGGAAVLRDPVFRSDLSFDQRTAAFVALLHRHVDPGVRRGDWLLVTVATQCEARSLAAWLAELPERKRPWTLALFPSDRWNRAGLAERNRQLEEMRVLARELAALAPRVARRLILASHAIALRGELATLLGTAVAVAPMAELVEGIAPREPGRAAAGRPPRVGVLGGARPEKGSHLLPAIVRASRERTAVDFVLQLANEQLTAESFAELCALAHEPGIEVASGPLDRAGYLRLLASSDLVLFPYERIPYRQRASGIFSEAVLAGLPVVVPSGTWMAEQVAAAAAAGVVYEGDGPAVIAGAVAECVAALPELAAPARERAPAWRRTQSLEPFFAWLAGEIAARENSAWGLG